MSSATSQLYEPLIERDLAAIPAAVRGFREEHSSDELFSAIARFAVLSYAPSQHSKHALLCCLTAHELRDEAGDRFDELLAACARYAAESRQPWSEPPITDPPQSGEETRGDLAEIESAIEAMDRAAAEQWLARRVDDDALASDFFTAATHDFEDLGHKLIVSLAAWKLAAIFPPVARYATLRVAMWEMTAYNGKRVRDESASDPESLCSRLLDAVEADSGSIVSAHGLFLLDAAIEAAEIASQPAILERACSVLTAGLPNEDQTLRRFAPAEIPIVYDLARDCGATLKSRVVARRLRRRFPSLDTDRLVRACTHNLQNAPSLAEWSFA